MRKSSFVFYYFVILVFGGFAIFAFLKYTNILDNFNILSSKSSKTTMVKVVEREVSIALSDRIGNLKYYMEKLEYNGDLNDLATKAIARLFELTRTNPDERIRGCINPEAEFESLELRSDKKRRVAVLKVSSNYRDSRTERQKRVAKKQIYTTLLDVYRELDDCVFLIDGREYDY